MRDCPSPTWTAGTTTFVRLIVLFEKTHGDLALLRHRSGACVQYALAARTKLWPRCVSRPLQSFPSAWLYRRCYLDNISKAPSFSIQVSSRLSMAVLNGSK